MVGEVRALLERITANVEKGVVGKRRELEIVLVALLCRGHVLIEDVPGVGKTTLVRALARSLGCSFRRIQFTPDLLPSDITGTAVYDQASAEFVFRPGPINSQVVLADEINRASPKVQSALLECMEEGQVTVDGVTHPLPRPFLVLATQNPVEFEGTFPLPQAQLDRFFLRLRLGYPDAAAELEILRRSRGERPADLPAVSAPAEWLRAQRAVDAVYIDPAVEQYVVQLVAATRTEADLQLSASPRAAIALYRGSCALALLRGRVFVTPDDVQALVEPVLSHRLILDPAAQWRGVAVADVLARVLAAVPVPKGVRHHAAHA